MLIRRKGRGDIKPSEITPETVYINRRDFMRDSSRWLAAGALGSVATQGFAAGQAGGRELDYRKASAKQVGDGFFTREAPAPYEVIASYNNFYEFGTGKSDPARHAHSMVTDPWSVEISGEAELTGRFGLEDILRGQQLEERIYRLRCVEAWSMVIPWVGFPLADLLGRFKPTSKAKYVAFETLSRPEEMRGQRSYFSTLDWPYREGLRIDEAMHPLAILAVGLYGKELPNQNGAPLRLVVPWKYGFKSIKSIVAIRFTENQPATSWNLSAPQEYGFYSNVNPEVDHPRWSQARERRLPTTLFRTQRIATQMFNGYAEQVAHLYRGMDLRKAF